MAAEIEQLISRIKEMEDRYDELTTALGNLDSAILAYLDLKKDLGILRDYMESGQWKKDFEADEAGEVPSDLKRGVLSEDALYDLLERADKILDFARKTFA